MPPLRRDSYSRLLPPRGIAESFEANGMVGRGGGDRTTSGVEDAQVIDSTKQQKGEKPQKTPKRGTCGVHGKDRPFSNPRADEYTERAPDS